MEKEANNPVDLSSFKGKLTSNENFKRVISFATTSKTSSLILLPAAFGVRFSCVVELDTDDFEILTVEDLKKLIESYFEGFYIGIRENYYLYTIDEKKPLSSFIDSQPLYFVLWEPLEINMRFQKEDFGDIEPLKLKFSPEDLMLNFVEIIEKATGQPIDGLSVSLDDQAITLEKKDEGEKPSEKEDSIKMDEEIKELEVHKLSPGDKDSLTLQLSGFKKPTPGKMGGIVKESITVHKGITVEQFKKMILPIYGDIALKDAIIFVAGNQLRNHNTLGYYDFRNGENISISTFRPILRSKDQEDFKTPFYSKMRFSFDSTENLVIRKKKLNFEPAKLKVTLKFLMKKEADREIEVENHMLIDRLKEKVALIVNMPREDVRFAINTGMSNRMIEDGILLGDAGIVKEGMVLSIVPPLRGGGPMPSFVDVSNKAGVETLKFSKSAPKWRIACPGLCLEGKCENYDCDAYNQWVIMNKGYGSFDLENDYSSCLCPICKELTLSETCGFTKCIYSFSGIKRTDEGKWERYSQQTWEHVGEEYKRYDPKKIGKAEWKRLNIYTIVYGDNAYDRPKCPCCKKHVEPTDEGRQQLPCNHIYHKECFESLKSLTETVCPLCYL